MRGIIYYYSHSGNNKKLALAIQGKLDCDIREIVEVKKRKTLSILADAYMNRTSKLVCQTEPFGKYDVAIFVAPIWGGKIAAPLRTFIEKEMNNISNYYFISMCNGTIGQKDQIIEELSGILNCRPKAVCELWINNLLPESMRGKISHTFSYRIDEPGMQMLDKEINDFVTCVNEI